MQYHTANWVFFLTFSLFHFLLSLFLSLVCLCSSCSRLLSAFYVLAVFTFAIFIIFLCWIFRFIFRQPVNQSTQLKPGRHKQHDFPSLFSLSAHRKLQFSKSTCIPNTRMKKRKKEKTEKKTWANNQRNNAKHILNMNMKYLLKLFLLILISRLVFCSSSPAPSSHCSIFCLYPGDICGIFSCFLFL